MITNWSQQLISSRDRAGKKKSRERNYRSCHPMSRHSAAIATTATDFFFFVFNCLVSSHATLHSTIFFRDFSFFRFPNAITAAATAAATTLVTPFPGIDKWECLCFPADKCRGVIEQTSLRTRNISVLNLATLWQQYFARWEDKVAAEEED